MARKQARKIKYALRQKKARMDKLVREVVFAEERTKKFKQKQEGLRAKRMERVKDTADHLYHAIMANGNEFLKNVDEIRKNLETHKDDEKVFLRIKRGISNKKVYQYRTRKELERLLDSMEYLLLKEPAWLDGDVPTTLTSKAGSDIEALAGLEHMSDLRDYISENHDLPPGLNYEEEMKNIQYPSIEIFDSPKDRRGSKTKKKKHKGGFLPYFIEHKYSFKRQQIYKAPNENVDDIDPKFFEKIMKKQCFINALEQENIRVSGGKHIKAVHFAILASKVVLNILHVSAIKDFAKEQDIIIMLKYYSKSGMQVKKYGATKSDTAKKFYIFEYDNHYMPAFNDEDKVKAGYDNPALFLAHMKDQNRLVYFDADVMHKLNKKPSLLRDYRRKLEMFESYDYKLVKREMAACDGVVENIDNIMGEDGNTEELFMMFNAVGFYDIETHVDKNEKLIPDIISTYILEYVSSEELIIVSEHLLKQIYTTFPNDNQDIIYRTNEYEMCGAFLDDVVKMMINNFGADYKLPTIVLYAHNAKFDKTIIVDTIFKCGGASHFHFTQSDGVFYAMSFNYGGVKFVIRDSYKMISTKLGNFGQMFDIDVKKRFFNHNWEKKVIPITERELDEICNENTEEEVLNFGFFRNGEFFLDVPKYELFYCMEDTLTLAEGFLCFRNLLKDLTLKDCPVPIEILYYLTSASLVHNLQYRVGLFDGVKQLGSHAQLYCQFAVIGGRTMCSNNKKSHTEKPIEDWDVNSLYPTAMAKFNGFPIGDPEYIYGDKHCRQFLNDDDVYYVARIVVKKIGRKLNFPIVCPTYDLDKDGNMKNIKERNYTNDIVGKEFILTNITIEDLIKFQKAEIEFVDMLLWTEFNEGICNLTNDLYDMRMKYKAEGNNGMQGIFKLFLNSSYGKLIMKERLVETKFFDEYHDFLDFIGENSERIKTSTELGDNLFICETYKAINDHKNFSHCGAYVLAMSKRIMNRIFSIIQDMEEENDEIIAYYQDTDSILMLKHYTEELGIRFKNTYNEDLYGKQLGQLSPDFRGGKFSSYSTFLGKKMYYCEFEDGSSHIRLKGCPAVLLSLMTTEQIRNAVDIMYDGGTFTPDYDKFTSLVVGINNIRANNDFTRTFKANAL